MKYDQHFMLCYAKQLYNRRQYHTFITIEQDLSRQITSYDILYDLGNACYRLGKFSRAVEYYEKAHRMIPSSIQNIYDISIRRLQCGSTGKSSPNNRFTGKNIELGNPSSKIAGKNIPQRASARRGAINSHILYHKI